MVWWLTRPPTYIGGIEIHGRVMDIDDLREIVEYASRVTGWPHELWLASGVRSVGDLANLSNPELAEATIRAEEPEHEDLRPDRELHISLRRRGAGVGGKGDPELVADAAAFVLANSRPWYNRRHLLALAAPAAVVAAAGLMTWYAVDVNLDPRLWFPGLLILAAIGAVVMVGARKIDEKLARTRAGIKILGESRATLRERRWNQLRDLRAGLIGIAVGVAGTLIGLVLGLE